MKANGATAKIVPLAIFSTAAPIVLIPICLSFVTMLGAYMWMLFARGQDIASRVSTGNSADPAQLVNYNLVQPTFLLYAMVFVGCVFSVLVAGPSFFSFLLQGDRRKSISRLLAAMILFQISAGMGLYLFTAFVFPTLKRSASDDFVVNGVSSFPTFHLSTGTLVTIVLIMATISLFNFFYFRKRMLDHPCEFSKFLTADSSQRLHAMSKRRGQESPPSPKSGSEDQGKNCLKCEALVPQDAPVSNGRLVCPLCGTIQNSTVDPLRAN